MKAHARGGAAPRAPGATAARAQTDRTHRTHSNKLSNYLSAFEFRPPKCRALDSRDQYPGACPDVCCVPFASPAGSLVHAPRVSHGQVTAPLAPQSAGGTGSHSSRQKRCSPPKSSKLSTIRMASASARVSKPSAHAPSSPSHRSSSLGCDGSTSSHIARGPCGRSLG